MFFVLAIFSPCPECGGTRIQVSDVTLYRFFNQSIRQAPQGIQSLYLVDIHTFTGGAFQAHNST
jgi:hypothetical protein